jgi:hypothetical protein
MDGTVVRTRSATVMLIPLGALVLDQRPSQRGNAQRITLIVIPPVCRRDNLKAD